MIKKIINASYIPTFMFIFCLLGIVGNIEHGVRTSIIAILITVITGILTFIKLKREE